MPKGTIDNLASRVRRLAREAEKGMARKMQAAAVETARYAITHTPVDRGDARASWQSRINQRPRGQRQPPYHPHLPVLHSALLTAAAGRFHETANANAALRAIEANVSRVRLDDTIYVINAVEGEDGEHYLPALNIPGGTLQVGPFWIQRAEAEGREASRKEKVFE